MQYEMSSDKTARKVTASSSAASAAAVILFFLKIYVIKDTPLPDTVESALGLVIAGAVSWASAWIAGRLTRPAATDTIQPATIVGSNIATRNVGIPDDLNDKRP